MPWVAQVAQRGWQALVTRRRSWELAGPEPLAQLISPSGWFSETEAPRTARDGPPTTLENSGHFPQRRQHHTTEIPEVLVL